MVGHEPSGGGVQRGVRRSIAAAVFMMVLGWAFLSGGAVGAVGAPTATYPDVDQACSIDFGTTVRCTSANGAMLYLSVGLGEHTSGVTSIELYAGATGIVSGVIENAAFCIFPIGGGGTFDFDSIGSSTTTFTIPEVGYTIGTTGLEFPANVAGCSSLNFSFSAVAGVTYHILAQVSNAGVAGENKENQFRVRVTSGNATLGIGTASSGGTSFSNRDLPYAVGQNSSRSDYAMHFAPVSCTASPVNPVRFWDADFGLYQSDGAAAPAPFYSSLTLTLKRRPRGDTTDWSLIAADPGYSLQATGGDSAWEPFAPYLQAGYEYRLEVLGLSRPNAIEVILPDGVSQSVVETPCPSDLSACSGAPATLSVNAGATYSATFQVQNTGTNAWTAADFSLRTAAGQTTNYLTDGGAAFPPAGLSSDIPPGGTATFTFTNLTAPGAVGLYSAFWRMYDNSSGTWFAGSPPCGFYVLVDSPPPPEYRPWFSVTAGDVTAGGWFTQGTGTTCGSQPNAPLAAFNRGVSGGYLGAGTQLAAFDLGTVVDFVSAQPLGAPKKLTFANTGAGAASSTYGGNAEYVPCINNYFDTIVPDPTPLDEITNGDFNVFAAAQPFAGLPLTQGLGHVPAGDQVYAYDATGGALILNPNGGIGNTDLDEGAHVTLVVDGDVYIKNNIGFRNNGGWSNKDEIPSLFLVVRGNIYIDAGVTELSGIFVAQPYDVATPTTVHPVTGRAGGKIFTCATADSAVAPTISQMASTTVCGANRLTVNGAFLAQQVKLVRTTGDINSAGAPGGIQPAEVFRFTPDAWLNSPALPNPPAIDSYDSITTLPPIL